jgi:cytochrome c peroxidase
MVLASLHRKIFIAAALALIGVTPAFAGTLTAQQKLGKSLFTDFGLSHTGRQGCSYCHDPVAAFTDPEHEAASDGDDESLVGNRNSPTVMYSAFSPEFHYDEEKGKYVGGQFLDGRSPSLEDQAGHPFLNPIEMNNPNAAAVIEKLQNGPNAEAFKAVYGQDAFADTGKAYSNLTSAIAAYERSSELSPFTSKFDYYLKGKVLLSPAEMRGMTVFNEAGCSGCHIDTPSADGTHPLFTDFSYDNIGSPKNFESEFLDMPANVNPDGEAYLDPGLGGILGDPALYGMFKVPTLRNINLTGPYGHDGYFTTLDQIILFFATRDTWATCADPTTSAVDAVAQQCWPDAEFGLTMNTSQMGNLNLSDKQIQDIKVFLATLQDGYSGAVPEPEAWALLIAGFGLIGCNMRSRRKRLFAGPVR